MSYLIIILISLFAGWITFMFIPYIEDCGRCQKTIFRFQRNRRAILGRYHCKCYKEEFVKDMEDAE